jgi:hypothetical protein
VRCCNSDAILTSFYLTLSFDYPSHRHSIASHCHSILRSSDTRLSCFVHYVIDRYHRVENAAAAHEQGVEMEGWGPEPNDEDDDEELVRVDAGLDVDL